MSFIRGQLFCLFPHDLDLASCVAPFSKRPSSVPPQQRQPAPAAMAPTSADDLDYGFEGISAPEAEDMADAILDAMGMGPPRSAAT